MRGPWIDADSIDVQTWPLYIKRQYRCTEFTILIGSCVVKFPWGLFTVYIDYDEVGSLEAAIDKVLSELDQETIYAIP